MVRIAFDLDGTLLTCDRRQQFVLIAASRPHGFIPDVQAFWSKKRDGLSTYQALRAQGCDEVFAHHISRRWRAMVELPCWLALDKVFEDVIPTLANLRRRKVDCHVLTARTHKHWLTVQLHNLGLTSSFASITVVPPSQVAEAKASELTRLAPDMFVGDTESDALAAKRAGIHFAALDRGQRSRSFLCSLGVTQVAHDLVSLEM